MNLLVNLYRRLDFFLGKMMVRLILTVLVALAGIAKVAVIANTNPSWAMSLFGEGFTLPLVLAGLAETGWWVLLIWLGLLLPFFLVQIVALVPALVLLSMGNLGGMLAVEGMAALTFSFIMLTRLLQMALQAPAQPLAIAHTVVKEAMRLRVSVFFIAVILILLPLIPVLQSSELALRYKVQSFLNWSLGMTFVLAACMTIFLSCATVSFEIRDRQIWQLMTKPVTRLNYLIGKWIGIMAVNLVILLVAGLSIFGVIRYLEGQPTDAYNARAIHDTILTARISRQPDYETLTRENIRDIIDAEIEKDRTLKSAIDQGVKDELRTRREMEVRINNDYLRAQREVPLGEERTYTFSGLQASRRLEANIELKYQFHIGADDNHQSHPVTFAFRDQQSQVKLVYRDYVPTQTYTQLIPWEYVTDEGELELHVFNGRYRNDGTFEVGRDMLNFDASGLEMYFTVGGFSGNFFRAMIVMWVKLSFLAMLGLAVSTVLSFSVAVLFTFTVFLAAAISPFLSHSLDEFRIDSAWRVDQWVIKGIAQMLVMLLGTFGEYSPTSNLVRGLLISWGAVVKAIAVLGLLWSGVALALGYLFFRERELATYSGQG